MPDQGKPPSLAKLIFDAGRSNWPELREWSLDAMAAVMSGDTKQAGKLYARGLLMLQKLEDEHERQKRNKRIGPGK